MFLLRRPSLDTIEEWRLRLANAAFSYEHVGCTRGSAPSGFTTDRNRVFLGTGKTAFESARRALFQWRMFPNPLTSVFAGSDEPVPGTVAAVLASHFGFYSLNFCRVVYLLDEDGPIRRAGFAYGTLIEHAERGEELFSVEWHRRDDSVHYEVLAYSQPAHWLARLGYPLARHLQRRFARESLAAMAAAARH